TQWLIDQTGLGVLGLITNNTYIDGITHRRMRESLLTTFNDAFVLDLHGSLVKEERTPDGTKDENVFDIQQGVSIGLFVRRRSKIGNRIRHSDLWGVRSRKYAYLIDNDKAACP